MYMITSVIKVNESPPGIVRSKVNSLRKTVESERQGILELNNVKECLKELQGKYVFVPADKAANHIIKSVSVTTWSSFTKSLVCGQTPATSSNYYISETEDPKEISRNHISYMKSLGFVEDSLPDRFPSFCCTPKLDNLPYKHCFIVSSFDCTTEPLSILFIRILSAIKRNCQNLSSVIYSRTGINEMWILRNSCSSELLQKMNRFCYPRITSTQTLYFSTLYIIHPLSKAE